MRSQKEIEDMTNRVGAAWDQNCDPFLEGLMAALQWVLDPESEDLELD